MAYEGTIERLNSKYKKLKTATIACGVGAVASTIAFGTILGVGNAKQNVNYETQDEARKNLIGCIQQDEGYVQYVSERQEALAKSLEYGYITESQYDSYMADFTNGNAALQYYYENMANLEQYSDEVEAYNDATDKVMKTANQYSRPALAVGAIGMAGLLGGACICAAEAKECKNNLHDYEMSAW